MCGIAGFIDPKIETSVSSVTLQRMLASIGHRGPDYRGTWLENDVALGHNRLSIIDLSADGNQPMHGFDSAITFNGEIYNYLEVKADLERKGYVFHSKSDTEVILAAYRHYGENCVEHFVGMWAFALWDKKQQLLFCSRDRFGIKPFYYISEGDRFYFGSEYKALKQSPVWRNNLNMQQVSRGLQLGWVCYNDETYFEKLKALPAACNLIYQNGKLTVKKYWDLKRQTVSRQEFKGRTEEFRNRFFESVKIHMRSDVEVAVCLSGGIDSSALTGAICNIFPELPVKTFSIYYDGKGEVDERPFINAVIEKYPHLKPDFYKPLANRVNEYFHDIIDKSDVPATGSSFISHYFLVKRIHEQGIKVVLDGQGSDEFLAGYMHSFYRHFASQMQHGNLSGFWNGFTQHKKRQQLNFGESLEVAGKSFLSLLKDEQSLFSFEYFNFYPFLLREKPDEPPFSLERFSGNKLDDFLYQLLFTTSLPTILHYVDRMTMSYSLESRVPFLDHRLVEYGFTLPEDDKIKNATTKYILRESLKDILPQQVYDRRDKKGFVTPGETIWLRGPMKQLTEINFKLLDFIDRKKTERIMNDYKAGSDKNARLVWRLATLNYWIKNFV